MAPASEGAWFLAPGLGLLLFLWLLRARILARDRRTLFATVASLGAASEARIAERARWPPSRVRRGLKGLERRGFIERSGEGFCVRPRP